MQHSECTCFNSNSKRFIHHWYHFLYIPHIQTQAPTSSIAKDVRWLQLQVVSSSVALTREQPAELQPPPPPEQHTQMGKLITATNRLSANSIWRAHALAIQSEVPECTGGCVVRLWNESKLSEENNFQCWFLAIYLSSRIGASTLLFWKVHRIKMADYQMGYCDYGLIVNISECLNQNHHFLSFHWHVGYYLCHLNHVSTYACAHLHVCGWCFGW